MVCRRRGRINILREYGSGGRRDNIREGRLPLFFCFISFRKKIHPAQGVLARAPLGEPRAPWLRPGPGSRRGVGGALSPTDVHIASCFMLYQRSIQGPAQCTIGALVVMAKELRFACSRLVKRRNLDLPAPGWLCGGTLICLLPDGYAEELRFACCHGYGGRILRWLLPITSADAGILFCLFPAGYAGEF